MAANEEKKPAPREPVDPPEAPESPGGGSSSRVKFEIFGEEMIEKRVKASGNSGRVYLPPDWVGHRVKIIRID